jgi:hypothetical protein
MRLIVALVAGCLISGPALAKPCVFDTSTLSFEGTPAKQAKCLLRPVAKWGRLAEPLSALPPVLDSLLGAKPAIPSDKLAALAKSRGLLASPLGGPVSRARGGAANAPEARYFVIHDTSSPWLGDRDFPQDLDTNAKLFPVSDYLGTNAVAHAFVGRTGIIGFGHDFSVPWRATKLESRIGLASKGLFLHIENVQPRRRDATGGAKNDAVAPMPGLSAAQYDSLALLYIVASVRAGQWLIPAYHAALDDGFSDGHDDPQNFVLEDFDRSLGKHLRVLRAT